MSPDPPAPIADAQAEVASPPVELASGGPRFGGPRSSGAVWACAALFVLGVALLGVDQRRRIRGVLTR